MGTFVWLYSPKTNSLHLTMNSFVVFTTLLAAACAAPQTVVNTINEGPQTCPLTYFCPCTYCPCLQQCSRSFPLLPPSSNCCPRFQRCCPRFQRCCPRFQWSCSRFRQ